MSKWTEFFLRTAMAIIMGVAAILTTVILGPFMFIMWLIQLFKKGFSGKNRGQ